MSENNFMHALQKLRGEAKGFQPPCMGWSTWNHFRQNISEKLILESAREMKTNGLLAAGYRYINLDDCWQSSVRGKNFNLQFDRGRFPGGEKIISKLNGEGFRVGLYSSAGTMTCEDMPGSYGFEETDAETFARWGVSFLKYDYCHIVDLETDPHHLAGNFPLRTPPNEYIGIPFAHGEPETIFSAVSAQLDGTAVLELDAVRGLCGGDGSAIFTAEAPEDGRYELYIGYRKTVSPRRRYVQAAVNGAEIFDVWFPPSSGWSDTGRAMTEVNLKKGTNTIELRNPIRGQKEDSVRRYRLMGEALRKAYGEREIIFSVCEHGRAEPWLWAADLASSWRIGPDIRNDWKSVSACYEKAVSFWEFQRPGAYNDPDMLEVGNGGLTPEQNAAHFSLWCMLNAPLILGCDVRNMDAETLAVITNRRLIQINQDPLLLQAKRVYSGGEVDVLVKPLWDGSRAVCVFNKSENKKENLSVSIAELFETDGRLSVENGIFKTENIFTGQKFESENLTADLIPPCGTEIYLVAE